jgi:hypothetical protein
MRNILTGEPARDPGRPRVKPGPRPGLWDVYVTPEQAAVLADEVILDPDPAWRQEIVTLPGATLRCEP